MKIKISGTEIEVSNIALGTDSYGSIMDEALSFKMLDYYSAAGGNLVDTAECYADWVPGGRHASEKVVGKWMKSRNNRNKMIISTKGGFFKFESRPRLSKQEIFEDLDGSLERLKTDYIDIYWLHRDAPEIEVEPIMDALSETVRCGKVRCIGVSNWSFKRVEEANRYLEKCGNVRLVASQIQFSAASPNPEQNEPDLVLMNKNEYDYFKNKDMTVFAFAAQAKGFFSKYDIGGESALSEKARNRYYNEKTLKAYQSVKEISKNHNCSVGAAALAAVLNVRDFDTVGIIGCKNISQLTDSLSAGKIVLSEEETAFIRENMKCL